MLGSEGRVALGPVLRSHVVQEGDRKGVVQESAAGAQLMETFEPQQPGEPQLTFRWGLRARKFFQFPSSRLVMVQFLL